MPPTRPILLLVLLLLLLLLLLLSVMYVTLRYILLEGAYIKVLIEL